MARILLAEDDPELLELAVRMLEGLGYAVLPATLPAEALRLAKEYPGGIDLLLTDIIKAMGLTREEVFIGNIINLNLLNDNDRQHIGEDVPEIMQCNLYMELEALPLPARDMLKISKYREPFLSKPFTSYQAGRGLRNCLPREPLTRYMAAPSIWLLPRLIV